MSDIDLDDPFAMSSGSSPSPSPPSSPALGPVDSSPPSSPSMSPITTPLRGFPGPSDPYAGSNKWTRRPRQYDSERRVKLLGWDPTKASPERDKGARDRPHPTPPRTQHRSHSQDHTKRHRGSGTRGEHGKNASISSLAPMDPYAASAHATWEPPRREKKPLSRSVSATSAYSTSTVLSTETAESSVVFNERSFSQNAGDDDDIDLDDFDALPPSRLATTEEEIWEEKIASAIENGNGEIDLHNASLTNKPLTYIPSFISDLAGLVVLPSSHSTHNTIPITSAPTYRPFTRSVTLPASSSRAAPFFDADVSRKLLQKADSTALVQTATSAMLPVSTSGNNCELRLWLSGNRIRSLPLELFQLTGLTILALRSNCISVLPSQIAQLTNLRELYIPFNRLRWLPSEILSMQPMNIQVTNNRWIRPPPPDEDPDNVHPPVRPSRAHTRPVSEPTRACVSPTTVHFTIPPLTELCLRLLLSPVAGSKKRGERRPETVLETFYALPFSGTDRSLPPTFVATLRACLPSTVAKPAAQPSPSKKARHPSADTTRPPLTPDADDAEEPPPSIGVCPSPVHRTPDGDWVDGRIPVFVKHGEERFTWEREIVGTDVRAECDGAGVPVRWRGCWKGCLDFLAPVQDQDDDEPADVIMGEEEGAAQVYMAKGELDVDDDTAATTGVHVVQFTAGGPSAGFDDFE
ncbi:uncharacterized protein B0H18DRAFT_1208770 [Fomitopsis serialis]|uniref:uncharacterized protein n=1 Tax=Fomitopsis serialis TaxID=139415 RepID=UPI002008D605|nr:uncharacterized protein B0H18DRAFT_1208770 [Neoantrodia serialis]KAH9931979.1 hypothetical protein B0H18DRAFT_1208770 [Neoantrodia serialis]